MVEDNCRDGGRPTHARGTPEQTGVRARAHMVNKQLLIVLATEFLNVVRWDASIIHSAVDRELPQGLRAIGHREGGITGVYHWIGSYHKA